MNSPIDQKVPGFAGFVCAAGRSIRKKVLIASLENRKQSLPENTDRAMWHSGWIDGQKVSRLQMMGLPPIALSVLDASTI